MLQQLINVVGPVLACIALGWAWAWTERPFDTRGVAELVTLVGAPCLVFYTLLNIELDGGLLVHLGLATLVLLVAFSVVSVVVLRLAGLDVRTYVPPLIFPNIGNIGLPLCLFAFGQQGLALGVVIFAVMMGFNFTVGIWLYSGSRSPMPLLKSPLIHAVWIAAVILWQDWHVPVAVMETTRLLGEFTIPVMMLTLGVSLARMRVTRLLPAVLLSLLRIAMGVVLGWLVAELFGLQGTARSVFILQAAMPVAVFAYLFAVRYQRSPEEMAGLVVVSTVISLATLPLLLLWLMP